MKKFSQVRLLLLCSFRLVSGVARAQSSYQRGGSLLPECLTSTLWHPTAVLTNPVGSFMHDLRSAEGRYTAPVVTQETVNGIPLKYSLAAEPSSVNRFLAAMAT